MMKDNDFIKQAESDLGLNGVFIKGKQIEVKNCWHFYTDGNAVDRIFDDDDDFIDGMNRVFVTKFQYRLLILAFTLMDTHLHFVIYGNFNECQNFMHKYMKLTSMHISNRHSEKKKLNNVTIHHQIIDNDFYLKIAICYVIKNAPVGGLHYNSTDYPWSSGALYFRRGGYWTSPEWLRELDNGLDSKRGQLSTLSNREKIALLKTRLDDIPDARIINRIIFPGDYVDYHLVERLFKSHRSYNYFMCITKEEDIDSKGGAISRLTIPIYEIREYRNELCRKLFDSKSIRGLDLKERVKLAKIIKSKYGGSTKQIAKVCGLIYEEVKDLLR